MTVPAGAFNEGTFEDGVGFDGYSVGFKSVEFGDMLLISDPPIAKIDHFWEVKTLSITCYATDADTKIPFAGDPRNITKKAEGSFGPAASAMPNLKWFLQNDSWQHIQLDNEVVTTA